MNDQAPDTAALAEERLRWRMELVVRIAASTGCTVTEAADDFIAAEKKLAQDSCP